MGLDQLDPEFAVYNKKSDMFYYPTTMEMLMNEVSISVLGYKEDGHPFAFR